MIPHYDTIALQDEISKILDRYRPENIQLPDIESEEFLEILQKYNEKLSSDCKIKMRILMVESEYKDKNVSVKLHELIKSMIDECNEKLEPEEKKYLRWEDNKNPDSYSFVPKPDTIDKWMNSKRIPSRLSIYKISCALHLPVYLYETLKNMDIQSREYILSANYLFNKVYNQRYSSKEADELIFVYQLINGIYAGNNNWYLQAMKMIADYYKKSMLCKQNDPVYDNSSTILIIGKGIEMMPEPFVDFLSVLSPVLNIMHSSVNKKIRAIVKKFADGDRTSRFLEKYYDSNNELIRGCFNNGDKVESSDKNMADYVLISPVLKNNLEFLNRRMSLCYAVHNNSYSERRLSYIKNIFAQYGVSDNIFRYLSSFEISDMKDIMIFIIREIMLTEKELYGIFSEDDKTNAQTYKKARELLIITHFLDYWSGTDYEPEYHDYRYNIDNILMKSGYNPLYTKNLFDSFFLMTAQLKDPVASYYNIINETVLYYWGFQNNFLSSADVYTRDNYNSLSSKVPIIKYMEAACFIDDKGIQKQILRQI